MGKSIICQEWVRQCRKKRGISQIRLAKEAGVSTSYIKSIENYKRDLNKTSVEIVAAIFKVLDFSLLLHHGNCELYDNKGIENNE